jgi:hypothetical protein
MALASRADDGVMTVEDLAEHRCDWVDPISIEYRGYHLHEIPPNGQGIARSSRSASCATTTSPRCRWTPPTACTSSSRR